MRLSKRLISKATERQVQLRGYFRRPKSRKGQKKDIFDKFREYENFLDLRKDPEVAELLLSNYNSLRNLWEDSQRIKMREISPMEILLDYNERKGRPVLREVLAREFLLDWVASNLLFI